MHTKSTDGDVDTTETIATRPTTTATRPTTTVRRPTTTATRSADDETCTCLIDLGPWVSLPKFRHRGGGIDFLILQTRHYIC